MRNQKDRRLARCGDASRIGSRKDPLRPKTGGQASIWSPQMVFHFAPCGLPYIRQLSSIPQDTSIRLPSHAPLPRPGQAAVPQWNIPGCFLFHNGMANVGSYGRLSIGGHEESVGFKKVALSEVQQGAHTGHFQGIAWAEN